MIDPNNPGIAEGIGELSQLLLMSGATFSDALPSLLQVLPTIFSAHSYDCAILIALAAEAAKSTDPADIAAQMVAVP